MIRLEILNKEKEKLIGVFHKINDKKEVIIVCHGHDGSKDRNFIKAFCKTLNKAEYNSFMFDFSGNGESEGKFEDSTYSKGVKDLRFVIDYFKKNNYNKIGLVGHSMGGTVCILEASKDKRINFVISVAGVSYPTKFINITLPVLLPVAFLFTHIYLLDKIYDKRFPVSPKFIKDTRAVSPMKSIKKVGCPVLFIYAGNDKLIKIQEGKDIFNVANEPKKFMVIKGAGHCFKQPKKTQEMISKSVNWLKDYF